jgi:hypothetical protein
MFAFQALQTDHKNFCFSTFHFYTPYTVLKSHRGKFTAQLFSQMFTQVLCIMTSLIITSHSKERPLVLPHNQAIFQSVNSRFTTCPCHKHRVITKWNHFSWKTWFFQNYYLTIYPMFWGYFSYSEGDSDDSVRVRKIVCPKQRYSDSQTSSEDSDDSKDTSNVGGTTWVKEDETPNLRCLTGNPGVKQIPSDPT